jgi:hypothetical protein
VLILYNQTYVDEDVIEWGIYLSELDQANPVIMVRDHRQHNHVVWEATGIVLSEFLFLIVAWTVVSRSGYEGSREFAYGLMEIPLDIFATLKKQLDQWNLANWPYGDTALPIGGTTEILYLWCGPVGLMAKREDLFSQVEAIIGFPVDIVTPDDGEVED